MRGHENNAKVLEIQTSLWAAFDVPTLLEPGRSFVMEGDLFKLRRSGRLKQFRVFLFNNLFVYATARLLKGYYHYHNSMEYHGVFEADCEVAEAGYETEGFGFRVTGPKGVRIFVAKTAADRTKWIDAINACVDKRNVASSHRKSVMSQRLTPAQ